MARRFSTSAKRRHKPAGGAATPDLIRGSRTRPTRSAQFTRVTNSPPRHPALFPSCSNGNVSVRLHMLGFDDQF